MGDKESGGLTDNFCLSSSVLPFVQKILLGTPTTKDYNKPDTYGSPMGSTYPWGTAVPTKAA